MLKFAHSKYEQKGMALHLSKRPKPFSLKLTSLIDMFTLILIFLLKSFSAEGDIMLVADDLILPESTATQQPKVASIVAISDHWVMLDGKQVVETDAVLRLQPQEQIQPLVEALRTKRQMAEDLGQVRDQMDFSGEINIQADEKIPYLVIKKVMMTCGATGFNDIMLAVTEAEQ